MGAVVASAWGVSWANAWGNSWGSIAQTAADTADGGYEWEAGEHIRKRIEEIRGLRRKDDKRKREAEKRLTGLIEDAYNRALGIEPEIAEELTIAAVEAELARPSPDAAPFVQYDWNALARDLAGLESLLDRINERRQADYVRTQAQMMADETEDEDLTILLLAA
jgi:hypothetical protein